MNPFRYTDGMNISRRAALGMTIAPLLAAAPSKGVSGKAAVVPKGLWPVMLTPFKQDQSIDWNALDALTDWYIESGSDGLFACCQSSEVWSLTEDERIQVTARVVKRAGKIPVVTGGLPGYEVKNVGPFVQRIIDTGAKAAVLTTSQVTEKSDPDTLWRDRVETILSATGNFPFGLYEAPSPYKRLLSEEMMHWAGKTGRFVFHKDTSCDIVAIEAKCKAVKGTPFRFYNANVETLVDGIHKGADGFSGIAANAWPKVVAYATHKAHQLSKDGREQTFLSSSEKILSKKYPLSAKVLANMAGVPIVPVCRRNIAPVTEDHMQTLREIRKSADNFLG